MPGYLWKLSCLSLASLFIVHLAVAIGVTMLTPAAVRVAGRIRPSLAANLLLLLRLFPVAFAVAIVIALCVPSYVWFEPEAVPERAGAGCILGALLGAAILGMSIARAWGAAVRSLRYARHCRRVAREVRLRGAPSPVWVIEGGIPCIALAGVFRSRIFISCGVVSALDAEQLAAAVWHERAHQISRDNLKRFFVALAPAILPFMPGFENLERAWERFTEWAADDRAVEGNMHRSLALAAALVGFARLAGSAQPSPLTTSLLPDRSDLARRIDRLLRPAPPQGKPADCIPIMVAAAIPALAILLPLLVQSRTLYSVHRLLESLMR